MTFKGWMYLALICQTHFHHNRISEVNIGVKRSPWREVTWSSPSDNTVLFPSALFPGLCPVSFEICPNFTFSIIFSLNTYFLMVLMTSLPTHLSSFRNGNKTVFVAYWAKGRSGSQFLGDNKWILKVVQLFSGPQFPETSIISKEWRKMKETGKHVVGLFGRCWRYLGIRHLHLSFDFQVWKMWRTTLSPWEESGLIFVLF